MKQFIIIGLFAMSSVAIASGSHSGGHEHGQPKSSDHGHDGGNNHGSGRHTQSTVGMPAKPGQATKTINVELLDTMRFKFSEAVNITDGDIVKFVVTNKGHLPHEFSIGNKKEQNSHRKMMRNMPNMHHQDGNAVSLKPGETQELTWHFKGNESVMFACNIPGHYEAGMHHTSAIHKRSTPE